MRAACMQAINIALGGNLNKSRGRQKDAGDDEVDEDAD
jgi:hypothetical protein